MATSWMIIDQDGKRKTVDVRPRTKRGVQRSCQRAKRSGTNVIAGYVGGPRPIALCPKVWPVA